MSETLTLEQRWLDRAAMQPWLPLLDEWLLPGAYTGLPKLRSTSHVRRGGAHPVVISAAGRMASLKEIRAMDEWRAAAPTKEPKGGGGGAAAAE